MKKIMNICIALVSILFIQSCEEDFTSADGAFTYVAFSQAVYSTGVDVGGTADFDIKVYTSKMVSVDRTFNVVTDASGAAAGSYQVPATVVVPAGSNEGTLTVTLSDVDLGIGVNKLKISFDNVVEGFGNGAATTLEYVQNCTEVSGTMDITFDRWGSEVSWEILDALDGVVASGGGYSDTGSGTSTSDSVAVTLCSGRTYTLKVIDAFGDGWGAVGSYTLTIGGVVKASGDGDFEFGESTAFDTNN